MCQHRIINPGLPVEQFDGTSFDSDDDSPGPIEDEHQMILNAQGIQKHECAFSAFRIYLVSRL